MIATLVAATLAQWRVERSVHTPAHRATVAFTIPASVYAHAQPDLADLRLLSDGEMVPYAIAVPPAGTTVGYDTGARVTSRTNGVTYYALDEIAGVPIERLDIVTSTPTYVRSAELQGSDGDRWTTIASGTLIRTKARQMQSLRFPEAQHRQFRLLIYDRDDPSLEALSIEGYGSPRRIVFDVQPHRRYALYYGNGSAHAPQFDYSQTHHVTWGVAERVSLGTPQERSSQREPARALPDWVLWAALAAASVAVAWLAVRSTAA